MMIVLTKIRRSTRAVLVAGTTASMAVAALVAAPAASHAAGSLPCDIYGSAGSPCVAAHSTVRALFSSYNGSLYQVKRASDGTTRNVGLLSAGGYANAVTQDQFCATTSCIITIIYDQSSRHNDLTIEGPGTQGGQDAGADATALPVSVGGHGEYGVSISAGMGYRHYVGSGVATSGQPEGMYMVTSASHVNDRCCFDYGNVEARIADTGNGHMDAINFGTECWFSPCSTSGLPRVQGDLENGLFAGGNGSYASNSGNGSTYVTALLKNDGQNHYAIKDGNAQSGGLNTRYDGAEPNLGGYVPMHQEGSIVLGTGGDNSNGSIGSFFEGVMTSGYPTDAADNAVQANIVSVGYGGANGIGGGTLTPGSSISLRATTACCTTRYIRHQNGNAVTSVITSSSSALDKADATWIVRAGLANTSCVSFESKNFPGDFLRHSNFVMYRQPDDGSGLFRSDATFCPQAGKNGQGNSFASSNFPTKFIRHYNNTVYIADTSGTHTWDAAASFNDDVSWVVSQPWS